MFRTIMIFCLIVLFLQVLLISAQNNNVSSNSETNKPTNVQASPTISPTNTATPNQQPTATPTKTESAISKIPNGNGWAEIDFLGTDETDKNKLTLKIRYKDDTTSTLQKKTFLVNNSELKSLLSKFKEGDKVSLEFTKEKDSEILKDIGVKSVETNGLFSALLIILFPIVGVWLGHKLILGEDNLYSKSKFQIVLWFFVLIGVYLAVNILRVWYGDWSFVGGVGIPTNLLLLTGLSSLTFVGAKAITEGQVVVDSSKKPKNYKPNFFYDLFHGDNVISEKETGEVTEIDELDANGNPTGNKVKEKVSVRNVDLGDFQMVVITLLAVGVYIVQAISFTGNVELHQFITLPDVDSTILAAFGLGQGAYLVKKYAS